MVRSGVRRFCQGQLLLKLSYLLVSWVLGCDSCASFACEFKVAVASKVRPASRSASRKDFAVISFFGGVGVRTRAGELDSWDVSCCVDLTPAGGTSAVLSSVLPIFVLVVEVPVSKSVVVSTFWSFIVEIAVLVFVR